MTKEIKPVQVSEKAVRNWRRNLLIGGIVGLTSCLLLAGSAIWLITAAALWAGMAELCGGIVIGILTLCLIGKFITMLRDYRGSAWMKTFWEDGE